MKCVARISASCDTTNAGQDSEGSSEGRASALRIWKLTTSDKPHSNTPRDGLYLQHGHALTGVEYPNAEGSKGRHKTEGKPTISATSSAQE